MIELNSAHIIRETRQTKHYLPISSAELAFVTACPDLSDGEKLIWLTLANESALDPHYACTLTQGQLAKCVNKTIGTVTRAITNLRIHGFLKSESVAGGALTYFLTLPPEGLHALLIAPSRNAIQPLSKTTKPHSENDILPLPKTLEILINNNIINNNNNKNHNFYATNESLHTSPAAHPSEPINAQDADALIVEYKQIMREIYHHLPVFKRASAAITHFTPTQRRIIHERQLALAAMQDEQQVQLAQSHADKFNAKLATATPVPASRTPSVDCKLVEFEFENEHFLVEEAVKNQILNEIPKLYSQKKIKGEAREKTIGLLLKEIFYYVAKGRTKCLDSCQLKRFYTARKLCVNGAWQRPKGLMHEAIMASEKKWKELKTEENAFSLSN
jgi:hypothetical protein